MLVQFGQPDQRAVQIDRLLVSGLPQQRQHPLAFAQRIDPDQVAALGKQQKRMQQLVDLLAIRRMAEDRQAKRRLGNEEIAMQRLERRTSRVRPALVIAGSDDPAAAVVEHDLGAA